MLPVTTATGSPEASDPPNDHCSLNSTQLPSVSVGKLQRWVWPHTVNSHKGDHTWLFPLWWHIRTASPSTGARPSPAIEHDHQGWHQIQMFVHPAVFKIPLGCTTLATKFSANIDQSWKEALDNENSRDHLATECRRCVFLSISYTHATLFKDNTFYRDQIRGSNF